MPDETYPINGIYCRLYRDVVVSKDGDRACYGPDDEGGVRLHQHVGHGADRHAAGQGRVLLISKGGGGTQIRYGNSDNRTI